MCDLSSCAQKGYMWGKKGREEERKKQRRERECAKRLEVFSCAKTEKAPQISLFTSLFSTSVRSFGPQECFFPLFRLLYIKACVSNEISSFLKHRIHPKHGSGRTSSLTRSNTRKRVVVVLFLLLCLLRVALPSLISLVFCSPLFRVVYA